MPKGHKYLLWCIYLFHRKSQLFVDFRVGGENVLDFRIHFAFDGGIGRGDFLLTQFAGEIGSLSSVTVTGIGAVEFAHGWL